MKPLVFKHCFAVMLALGITSAPVVAQQAQEPAPMQQGSGAEYSDSQLEKFVNASQKVAVVSEEYTPKLQATADEQERREVYREADEKMVKIVQDEGMTVEEFNGISQALQHDQQLMERVQDLAQ